MATPEEILKKYWGHRSFRPFQREIIECVLSKKDTLALLPTGGGKSLCYQIPALGNDGFALVISPLIALMHDQVMQLKELGIQAVYLHAGMHYNDVKRTLENMLHGPYKLLYVSPERLQTDLFREYLPEFDLNLIAVDEAHCISQWGYDFRPDYLKIADLRSVFPHIPVLALTASATTPVQADIIKHLQLAKPQIFKESFARNNLTYQVRYSENKPADAAKAIDLNQSSIIYCRSRRQTESTTRMLGQHGILATTYHAGMPREKREEAQTAWMEGIIKVICATTAFGMGINKADVRIVLHYDAPEHLEAYYQEAGRAGRDGAPAKALTLYNATDIKRLHESTALQYPGEEYLKQVYQAVAEYLQVPVGNTPDRYYDFDLTEFAVRFGLKATNASYALRLLQQEGLWTLTESVLHPTTVHFNTSRDVLDGLKRSHPDLSYTATWLLRLYSTIFHYPTPVNLKVISKQMRCKVQEAEAWIEQLHRLEVLEYNKPGEGPQLFFHHRRADSRHLLLDMDRIRILRDQHIARTEAMIKYLQNTTICRERLLLEYFGEQPETECGKCDVCIRHNAKPLRTADLKAQLFAGITEKGIALQDILNSFPDVIHKQVLALLSELTDEGILVHTNRLIRKK
ncbi:MAG: RecQ family ATP-dependent DNA helicase [Taibaiella sp.]|nr:RecQ family ATP-dependent DNA helicase [Taibaiella sp.]